MGTGAPARLDDLEHRARRVVEQLALVLQAGLLIRHAPAAVSDAFCATRLGGDWALPESVPERARRVIVTAGTWDMGREEAATMTAAAFEQALAGAELQVSQDVLDAERTRADRNLGLAHLLADAGRLPISAREAVAGYLAQCSVLVTAPQLAVMGATLASGGIHPLTGDRVLSSLVCRQVLSVMSSSGMYDAAGQWMAHVGIPAKSGVSGAVLGALPGQVGIGTYSPRLDPFGNSVRGVEMCRIMSEDLDLHIMEADVIGSTVVRSVRREGDTVHLHLQGVIRFGGGESVLAAMTELGTGADPDPVEWAHCFYPFSEEPDTAAGRAAAQDEGRTAAEALEQEAPVRAVVVHLERVDRVAPVGRRLIEDGLKRLRADGVQVHVEDPDGVLTGG